MMSHGVFWCFGGVSCYGVLWCFVVSHDVLWCFMVSDGMVSYGVS